MGQIDFTGYFTLRILTYMPTVSQRFSIFTLILIIFCLSQITADSQTVEIPNSKNRLQLQWPTAKHANRNISSTFGESRLDHFHNGIDIPGENITVTPVDEGTVILQLPAEAKTGEIPFGGGNTLLIRHRSFVSGYMHLNSISDTVEKQKYLVKPGQPLGLTGNTGHSGGAHLHFFVYDQQQNKFYNPLFFLNNDIYKDMNPPSIREFGVKLADQTALINIRKPFILSANFPLVANIVDSGKGSERWGVYYLRTYHDRKQQPLVNIQFDFIAFQDLQWQTSSKKNFEETYDQSSYILGNSFKNTKSLIIEAGGYNGPSVKESFTLEIKEK